MTSCCAAVESTCDLSKDNFNCLWNYVHKWCVENGFQFSKSKAVAVHFCQLRSLHLDPSLKLGGEVIKVVKEAKVLGILFDRKLTFISHIKALKAHCLKALDVLKVVANTNWGATCEVLLQLYRAIVRSKLDYGGIVYGSARSSYLKELNTVHNQGLRICLGVYRTSPVNSLLVEANEYTLTDKRLKLSLQYAVKLYSTPKKSSFLLCF